MSKSRKILISEKQIKLYSTHTNRLSSGNENHFVIKAVDCQIVISVANRTNCSDQ